MNKEKLIELILEIASQKDKIELYNLDALEFLNTIKSKHNQFYFIDPPYYEKGKDLYTNFYTHDDHLRVSSYVRNNLRTKKILITYDNVDEIKKMYPNITQEINVLNYYVATKRKANEVFIKQNII